MVTHTHGKLSDEQIHDHLIHMVSILDEEVRINLDDSDTNAPLYIHYVRVEGENPFPDLARLSKEVPNFIQRLDGDEEWCSEMLKCLKSLSLVGSESPYGFRALVRAMELNKPKYALEEFCGSYWRLADAAASLSSLRCLILERCGEGFKRRDPQFMFWNLARLLHDQPSEIWMDIFKRLCHSSLKSINLVDKVYNDLFLQAAAEEGLPRKLQHLQLVCPAKDDDMVDNVPFPEKTSKKSRTRFLASALAKTQWDPECNLTSLHVLFQSITNLKDMLLCIFQRISSLCLETYASDSSEAFMEEFLQLLDGSSLRHLYLLKEAWRSFHRREDQVKLLDYLDRTIECPLERIEGLRWADESLEQNCKEILKRNKVYRDGELLLKQQMPPPTAKLFMCGDAGVGKSTLRKNLTRWIGLPDFFQFSRSTIGIKLGTMRFGERTLVLCDLAGQPEFHTFHHYFVRGSDKDLFLLVCKAPSASEEPVLLEYQLRYWLRFIVAHRSLSQHKPKVLVLLNYFPDSERQDPCLRCDQVIREYCDHIDFGNPPRVYGLNVKRFQHVQELKPALGEALAELTNSRPRVPELCKQIAQKINSAPRPRIISLSQFKIFYGIANLKGQHLKACIMYLHDTGEVVFLEEEDDNVDESQLFIIVDVQWFLQDLIGQFLPRLERKSSRQANLHATQTLHALKARIGGMCDQEHIDYVLSCLDRLGVTLTAGDSGSDGKITILPLMQNVLEHWHHEAGLNTSYSFWGRRFDCKDSERRLLPFGIFNMLQVRLAGTFSRSNIGRGWLYLVENRIHIIIKIGGTRGEWYDKHWVDVLVRMPFDPNDYLLETGEKLFRQVKTSLFQLCGAANWGCPSLELEEKVIGPRLVEQNPSIDFPNVHELTKVSQKIRDEGMRYHYTWPLDGETTPAFQLLFPSERDAYFNDQQGALTSVQVQVEECLTYSEAVEPEEIQRMTGVEGGSIQVMDEDRIMKQIKRSESVIVREVKAAEEHIIDEIQRLELVVKNQMEAIRLQGSSILSKLQLHLEFEAPKYPFLTDESNHLQRISRLAFGSTSRLHFLCEHGQGCHVVENQKGIRINTSPEWFRKAAPVLIPTLRILFFALKITAIAGFGVVIPSPQSSFPAGLKEKAIDAVFEEVFDSVDNGLKCMVPSRNDLEMFQASSLLKGRNLGDELGLYQSMQNGRRVWLCQQHHLLVFK